MNCTFRFLLTKHLSRTTALSLLVVLFSPALSRAQITPFGDSYTNTTDATVNYLSREHLTSDARWTHDSLEPEVKSLLFPDELHGGYAPDQVKAGSL